MNARNKGVLYDRYIELKKILEKLEDFPDKIDLLERINIEINKIRKLKPEIDTTQQDNKVFHTINTQIRSQVFDSFIARYTKKYDGLIQKLPDEKIHPYLPSFKKELEIARASLSEMKSKEEDLNNIEQTFLYYEKFIKDKKFLAPRLSKEEIKTAEKKYNSNRKKISSTFKKHIEKVTNDNEKLRSEREKQEKEREFQLKLTNFFAKNYKNNYLKNSPRFHNKVFPRK